MKPYNSKFIDLFAGIGGFPCQPLAGLIKVSLITGGVCQSCSRLSGKFLWKILRRKELWAEEEVKGTFAL